MEGIERVMESGNGVILDAFMKCSSVFENHEKALVNVSGGADSDVMIDLCERVRTPDIEITYCFMDTGLEYAATKRHLTYLEDRYGIEIRRERAVKSIPTCCREHGQPFVNKFCSDMIQRLQRHGFQWEDEPLDVLIERYPGCTGAVKWWCNAYGRGMVSSLDIGFKRGLKEFLVENPPEFEISPKCCHYAKKLPKRNVLAEGYDLDVVGLRKFEGGSAQGLERASRRARLTATGRSTGSMTRRSASTRTSSA